MNKFILFSYPLMFVVVMTSLFIMLDNRPLSSLPVKLKPEIKIASRIDPTPTPRAFSELLLNYVSQAFGKQTITAITIMKEHNIDCNYGKGTNHVGLFAIDVSDPRVKGRDLLNCEDNIDVAKQIYQQEGFRPWGK